MKKEDIDINTLFTSHDQTISAYTKTLQVKRQYYEELFTQLSANKIEYATLVYNDLERKHKRSRFTEFSISDLLGIEKVEIAEINATGKLLEAHSFASMSDQFFETMLELIATKKNLHLNFYLINLINLEDNHNLVRDTFMHEVEPTELLRKLTIRGGSTDKLTSDDDSTADPHSSVSQNDSFSLKKHISFKRKSVKLFSQILNDPKISRKAALFEVKDHLVRAFIPNHLKGEIYSKIIPDFNSIDDAFLDYYCKVDPRMPKHLEDTIDCNVKTIFCTFSFFDTIVEQTMVSLLKIFFNYRPDIGYKSGMEIYAFILSLNMPISQSIKVLISLFLDYELLFGIFKGLDIFHSSMRERLHRDMHKKCKNFSSNKYSELIWNFFLYSVSNCFYSCFSLRSLK